MHDEHLSNGSLELTVATGFGPRITEFALRDDRNSLAELGEMAIELSCGRAYRMRGGHRLWVAPEVPEITYEPDNDPVAVARSGDTVVVTQSAPPRVPIEKAMAVTLRAASVEIRHRVTNRGHQEVELAPWAITQLPPGGTALLPLPVEPADPHGLQPNASVVLWPYTAVNDSPFTIRDRILLLDAVGHEATKVGTQLIRGWLAYALDGLVFVKRAAHVAGGRYLDMGASGQCYSCLDFFELETLGEQQLIAPGAAVEHRETWELHRIDPETPHQEIPKLLNLDGGEPV